MKIYDKAVWHIDKGEKEEDVVKRFWIIFRFLQHEKMLSDEGKEILELGIDSSVSLHEGLVNKKGKHFLDEHNDYLLVCPNMMLFDYLMCRWKV